MSFVNKKINKKLLSIVSPILVIFLIYISVFSLGKLHRVVVIEAGAEEINVSQFIKDKNAHGTFATDISAIDMSIPGVYKIEVKIGEKIYNSKLKIKDTIAPTAEVLNQEIPLGTTLEAKNFIINIDDATKVNVSFKRKPDFTSLGEQDILLLLEDEGNNKTELVAKLFIGKVYKLVKVEVGTKELNISDFLMSSDFSGTFITDVSKIDLNILGTYDLILNVEGEQYSTQLEVIDTVPPKGDIVHRETWFNDEIEAKEFVENIIDYTDVKVYFKEQPDFSKIGEQKVLIVLEDASGNKSELESTLTVKEDTEPPKIIGANDQTVYIGEKVSYRKDVSVIDNKDENIELVIDSSAVNLKKEGSYIVSYSATDAAGNTTTKTVTFTVKEKPNNYVDPEELHKLADDVLAKIIEDDMTDKEKLWAIFEWTKKRITYTGYSDKSDWMQGAIQGFKKGSGDCFTYYATARELLTRAGFENIVVIRVDGTHYWNLVYYEDGWYHFDTCPHHRKFPYVCFLRTDAEVEEYTKINKNYYNFDKTKYPATPTTPLE